MKRADAERLIAQDLANRQSKSADLVAHAFKDVLPIELSARTLLVFLQLGVIEARETVPTGAISLAQTGDGWVSACLQAALDLHAKYTLAAKPTTQAKNSSQTPAKYSWTWTKKIESDECNTSEEKAATFFNIVGTLAFLVACQLDPTFKDRYPYRNRFAASPYVNRNIVGVYGQEFRVDIFSLPLRAFRPNDLTDLGEACTPSTSPIDVIRKNLKGSLQTSRSPPSPVGVSTFPDPCLPPPSPQFSSPFCHLLPPSHAPSSSSSPSTPCYDPHASRPSPGVTANVLPPASQLPCIPSFPPPSVASLPPPPANTPPSVQPENASVQSSERLKQALEKQLNAPCELSTDFLPDLDSQYLSNKYACFQGFGITGEAKSQDLREAIEQELVYMQQHGVAQSHLQFVLGVAKTDSEIAFIREDAIGTEEVTLDGRVGSDVLEIIRLALGLGVATSQMLGAHPGFELSDDHEISIKLTEDTPVVASMDMRDDPAQSIPTSEISASLTDSGTSGGKRKRGSTIASSNKQPRLTPPLEYWAPSPIFFKIDDRRYFLDHLAQGRRSITGRQTRVWCAYLELKAEDIDHLEGKGGDHAFPSIHKDDMAEAKALLASKSKVFVGPYALKIQYADMDSPAMANDIVKAIRNQIQQDPERGKYLLVPEWEHRGHEVIAAIRGFQSVPSTVKNKYIKRQELVSVSLFKRTLDHYRSFGEVCRAVVDGYRAILWLHSCGLVHRDLSDGNLLLAREQPTTFTGPSERAVKVDGSRIDLFIVRRKPHEPKDVFGLVHDLDMAAPAVELATPVQPDDPGSLPSSLTSRDQILLDLRKTVVENEYEQLAQSNEEARLRHRTGTPPYMSVRILLGKSKAHSVYDDAESLFYVLYLFPFHHPLPAEQYPYPSALPRFRAALPDAIKAWAGGWNRDLHFLGVYKKHFFQGTDALSPISRLVTTWTKANRLPELAGFQYLVKTLLRPYILQHLDGDPPRGSTSLSSAVDAIVNIVDRTDLRPIFDVPGASGPLPMSSS